MPGDEGPALGTARIKMARAVLEKYILRSYHIVFSLVRDDEGNENSAKREDI